MGLGREKIRQSNRKEKNMSFLKGADISHHNGDNAVNIILNHDKDIKFFMVKATEGRTYVDPKCDINCTDTLETGRLLGMYHFARPDLGNSYEAEAANFLTMFRPYIGRAIPVLDWEDKALKYKSDWALFWVIQIAKATGVIPMIYVQQSAVKDLRILQDYGCGLWVARYNKQKNPGSVEPWKFWAMYQYDNGTFVSGNYDKNYFNGTKKQFMKYCESAFEEEDIATPSHCGCGCKCGN